MNYAIKTQFGYLAAKQARWEKVHKLPVFTPERARARWYQTESAACAAAKRLGIPLPFEIQHVSA